MIRAIQQFFERQMRAADEGRGDTEHALRLATAALLVEMTRADFHVESDERSAVYNALRRVFGLSAEETSELVELAEQDASSASSLFQFTHLIDTHFSPKRKAYVVEMLWRVAFADGVMDKYEEYLVRKVADLLHVSHRDFLQTKHRVQAELRDKRRGGD
ncbi:MAG TPA: TerB family tellurite resistance protein [Gammaproteobacteria bacterium]|nr:TerB family tellurite resistance protein [Gammaproteobacteria bacterium]